MRTDNARFLHQVQRNMTPPRPGKWLLAGVGHRVLTQTMVTDPHNSGRLYLFYRDLFIRLGFGIAHAPTWDDDADA